jgi:integrase
MPNTNAVSTKTQIEALQPKASNYPVPVVPKRGQAVRGLAVQVTPAGSKSFVLRFRLLGKQKTLSLGQFPDIGIEQAVSLAQAAWNDIREGRNPSDKKREERQSLTVKDLADRYILEHINPKGEGKGKEAIRILNKHIVPMIGRLSLALVGPADVSSLLFKMRRTPVQANRTRSILRTMFGRAEEWELRPLGSNPVSVVKNRTAENSRTRRLTDIEVKKLGATLRTSGEPSVYLLAVRMAILAGMRKGEISACRWSWVDLEAQEIHIPPGFHKTGMKTGKTRIVFLCDALVGFLKATAPTLGCPFVVPGKPRADDNGKPLPWEPIVALQAPWERIRDAAGLAPRDKDGEYVDEENNPGWHDLRRTFGSVASDIGLKGFAGELLGHAEVTVTDIYTRSAAEPLHEAVEKIGTRIEGILSGAIDPKKEAEERRETKAKKRAGASAQVHRPIPASLDGDASTIRQDSPQG